MCQCFTDAIYFGFWAFNILLWCFTQTGIAYHSCKVLAILSNLTQWSVAFTITLIAYERMQLMVYEHRLEFHFIVRVFVTSFVIMTLFATVPLMAPSTGTLSVYIGGAVCLPTSSLSFSIVVTFVTIIGTLSATAALYLKIYFHVNEASNALGNISSQSQLQLQQQRQVFLQFALIFIMLAVAWAPFFMIIMITIVLGQREALSTAVFFNMFTVCAHALFNAVIYTFKNPLVGEEVALTFPCLAACVVRRHQVPAAAAGAPAHAAASVADGQLLTLSTMNSSSPASPAFASSV